MAPNEDPSALSDIIIPEIASRIVARSVEAGRVVGIPDEAMIHSLIAFAGCLAHRQPNAEGWRDLLPRAAALAMERPHGD